MRKKNPPVTAAPCQPPLGKGALGTGDADCHSQCAHWLRNDRVFTRGAVQNQRADRGVRPYGCVAGSACKRGIGDAAPYGGLQGGRKKNPPVTALPCQPPLGKGAMETGDADCHSQCAHWLRNDRELYMGCGRAGRCRHRPLRRVTKGAGRAESPSHGCAVPAPFRQGDRGDGGGGLPQPVCAPASQ